MKVPFLPYQNGCHSCHEKPRAKLGAQFLSKLGTSCAYILAGNVNNPTDGEKDLLIVPVTLSIQSQDPVHTPNGRLGVCTFNPSFILYFKIQTG